MNEKRNSGIIIGVSLLVLLLSFKVKPRTMLSRFFSIQDAEHSNKALQMGRANTLPDHLIPNAKYLAINVLDPLTVHLGFRPITSDSSWFRSDWLNAELGGSDTSDHKIAAAIDLDSNNNDRNHEIVQAIITTGVPFKQLILERGSIDRPKHIHISSVDGQNRREILFFDGANYFRVSMRQLGEFYNIF